VARHAADNSGPVHPLVAAALAHRPPDSGGTHRTGHARSGQGSNVGWPAPAPGGGGRVGWPGGAAQGKTAEGEAAPAEEPAPAVRRGWRRLFGTAA
jgi:hypothetical protein